MYIIDNTIIDIETLHINCTINIEITFQNAPMMYIYIYIYQRCQLVRFSRKPYGFLRSARAYGRTTQSLRIFMILLKQIFCDLHEIFQNSAEFYREIFYLQNGGGQSSKSPRFQLTKRKQILPNLPNWEWIISFISGWLLSCVFFCVTGQWECLLTNCNRLVESSLRLRPSSS